MYHRPLITDLARCDIARVQVGMFLVRRILEGSGS